MKEAIDFLQRTLLAAVADLGGMATNLDEARDWADDGRDEEARLSLEAASAGAADVLERLRAFALKAEEACTALTALPVVKSKAGKQTRC